MVRSNTVDVLGIPGALSFLLGDRLDPHVHRDLKVIFHSDLMEAALTKFLSIFYYGILYRRLSRLRSLNVDSTAMLGSCNMLIEC